MSLAQSGPEDPIIHYCVPPSVYDPLKYFTEMVKPGTSLIVFFLTVAFA